MKSSYVESLRDGDRVDDVFLISSKSLGRTQNGSQYMRLKLADRTGVVEAIKWDACDSSYAGLSTDGFALVRGTVGSYQDRPQIVVDAIRPFSEDVDPMDFLPQGERDIDEMLAALREIIGSIAQPHLSQVLKHFFGDKQFMERFAAAPAAQKIHHAYLGGLLEHTLSVAQACDLLAGHYGDLSRDLLLTGAILHDVGKVEEFSWARSFQYSDSGKLIGHVVLGCSMVERAAEAVPGMHPFLKLALLHIVVSHHGEKEWGSPKRPKSMEAIVLHYVEDLDAKVNTIKQAISSTENDPSALWTNRNWVFDRPLLRGMPKTTLLEEGTRPEEGNNSGGEALL